MIRRTTIVLVEVVAGALALALLAIGLAAWRLSQGPIELDALTPVMSRALNPSGAAVRVEIDGTVAAWGGWENALEIRARGVRALNPDGALLASAPELNVDLSLRALARGIVAPTAIDVLGASVHAVRTEDGRVELELGEGQTADAAALPALLRELLAGPGGASSLGYLASVRVRDSTVAIEDRRTGRTWAATIRRARAERGEGGLRFALAVDVPTGSEVSVVEAGGTYETAAGTYALAVAFKALRPSALAGADPALAALSAIDLPLDGQLRFATAPGGGVPEIEFEANAGAGRIRLPSLDRHGVEIERARIEGRLHDGLGRMDIRSLSLGLGAAAVQLSGEAGDLGGEGRFRVEGTVGNVGMSDLSRLWPADGGGGRRWILANIRDGAARKTRFQAAGRLGLGRAPAGLDALTGDIAFDGLSVRYIPKMAPVERVHGSLAFDLKGLDIALKGGQLRGLSIAGGRVRVAGLDTSHQTAEIDVRVQGPARDALELMDGEPLFFARKLDIVPADIDGAADIKLAFRFPLLDALTIDGVRVQAEAEIAKLSWKKALLGRDATDGTLSLKADNRGLALQGGASVAGAPIQVRWTEPFVRGAPDPSRVELSGVLGDGARAALGLDMGALVKGPMAVRAVVTAPQKGLHRLMADLDLKGGALEVAALGWRKPAGTEARVRLQAEFGKDAPQTIGFDGAGPGLSARGQLRLGPGGKGLREIAFDALALGRTDLKGTVALRDGGYAVQATGNSLDVSRLIGLDEAKPPAAKPGKAEKPETPPSPAPRKDEPPLDLKIEAKTVWLAKDRAMQGVKAVLVRERAGWKTIEVDAKLGKDAKAFRVRYGPGGGHRELSVTAEDAGETLKAFGIVKTATGGKIEMWGKEAAPDAPLKGELSMKGLRINDAPALARLLSLASFTGILQTLSGEGLVFDRFKAPYSMLNGVVTLKEGSARSADLGFTFEGQLDLDASTMDVKGLLVPAYTINSLLGNIPILGDILTGGPDGGLFAATFSMTGALDDPSVGVNPLAVLTPGFLRNIFSIFDGGKPGDPAVPRSGRPGEGN